MPYRPLIVTLLILLANSSLAEDYSLKVLNDQLDSPWSLAFLPDATMLLTERSGELKHLDANGALITQIKHVPKVYAKSQGGLFDVLVDPEFETNGLIFLSYAAGPPKRNALTVSSAVLRGDSLTEHKVLVSVEPRKSTPVHYGGRMALLPDQTLLISSGDGFDLRELAQDKQNELGKTLRINKDGSIPANNPFGPDSRIFTLGHRNPQGLAVSMSGRLFLHEHGPKGGDELNVLSAGANYGWPLVTHGLDYSGAYVSPFKSLPGFAEPMHIWTPSVAPSGLAFYEGTAFPQWRGSIFVGTLVDKDVRRLVLKDTKISEEHRLFTEIGQRIRDIRVGPDGALYLLTEGDTGSLLKVSPN